MNTRLFNYGLMQLAVAACLVLSLAQGPALGAGGDLDPADQPLINALSVQIGGIDNSLRKLLAVGGGSPDPVDLPQLRRLASRLSEVDLHLGTAAVGGGSPDPAEQRLIDALIALRSKAEILMGNVENAVDAAETNPILNTITITSTLKFMLRTTEMIIVRVTYSLLHALPTPVPDL